ncbi:MAG: outer membrane lipoprotein LolB [Burkholderiales bacterium]|nr:outer membrane lipoprotein LolB [Burkholderiales bacterium]
MTAARFDLRRVLPALLLAVTIAGCAQLGTMPAAGPGPGGFEMTGRVAVKYGNDASSGRVSWQHSERSDELLLSSPLGQGLARLSREAGEVRLRLSDGRVFSASDAESLTEQILGWRLPLSGLPQWLRGFVRPAGSAAIRRDAAGRVSGIEQDGWTIEIETWREGRPERVRLLRPDLEIRLVIETWQEGAG